MAVKNEFPDFKGDLKELERFFNTLPRMVGNTAVNFFQDSFKKQGFQQGWEVGSVEKWKPRRKLDRVDRKSKKNSRAILVKSGRLKRSIRILSYTPGSVTVGSTVPYAGIHNQGGTINHPGGTAYFWKDGRRIYVSNRAARGKKYPRTKAHKIPIPQRQFIGNSAGLDRRISMHITKQLNRILRP